MGEVRVALGDPQGNLQASFSSLEEVSRAGLSWEQAQIALAWTEEQQTELQDWMAELPDGVNFWTCSWPDAALAGAFQGRPGLLLSTEHWTMYGGCACENGPEPICQALAMAREANHRTLAIAQGEGGLEWLCREGLKLLDEVENQSIHPLQRALGGWRHPCHGVEAMRQRAYGVRRALLDLADYPGPEPASLALLQRAGRRLSDLLRRLTSRVQLPYPASAAWLDGSSEGPLWEAMEVEFRKYLPGLRWVRPLASAEVGCLRLLQGAWKERARKAMDPRRTQPLPAPEVLNQLDADAWRQLSRMPL